MLGVSTKVLLQPIGRRIPSCVLFANTICSKPSFSSTAHFIVIITKVHINILSSLLHKLCASLTTLVPPKHQACNCPELLRSTHLVLDYQYYLCSIWKYC